MVRKIDQVAIGEHQDTGDLILMNIDTIAYIKPMILSENEYYSIRFGSNDEVLVGKTCYESIILQSKISQEVKCRETNQ